jgi:hypothetical protein
MQHIKSLKSPPADKGEYFSNATLYGLYGDYNFDIF